jgi:hypothetical protein
MIAVVLAAAAVSGIPVDVKSLGRSSGYGTVTLYRATGGAAALSGRGLVRFRTAKVPLAVTLLVAGKRALCDELRR